ncbi:hypothetical protein [Kitasatospora sp. NPDC085464]|uniref:hypothetical protein n=1 Tax=Kitasatospora sp. NPDC085464 TaxID=3364063 RepID=UPI0037C6C48C
MWWTDPENERLFGVVQRLFDLYQHYLGSLEEGMQPLVWGVGSAPDAHGRWTYPLVVASFEDVRADGVGRPAGRYPLATLMDNGWSDTRVWGLLRSWEVPPDTLIDLAGRPTAAGVVYPTDEVVARSPAGSATVGLPCRIGPQESGFITAGHLVPGKVQVDVYATGDGVPRWVTGTVVDWQDPVNAGTKGGYDYAVVALDDPDHRVAFVSHRGAMPPPQPPYETLDVVVYGGPSGRQVGSVTAALVTLGDARRQWLKVWQFAPSGRLRRGDSGSLAMVTSGMWSGSVLGHFVGGSGTSPHFFDHQYIQDLASTLDSGLAVQVTF